VKISLFKLVWGFPRALRKWVTVRELYAQPGCQPGGDSFPCSLLITSGHNNMPSRKFVKKSRKFLKKRPRKFNKKSLSTYQRSRHVVWPPTRIFARLTYSLGGSITTTTTLGEIFVAANNPNDPGLSLSALQPVWYDQIQAFYNRYRVWGSSIQVRCNNTTASVPYELVVFPTRLATGVTAIFDAVGQPHAKYRQGSGSAGNDMTTINHYMSSAKLFGTPTGTSNDFAGSANANPSLLWYWAICVQAFDATTSVTVADEVRLTLDIELFDKTTVDMSTLINYRKLIETKRGVPKRQHLDFSESKTPENFEHV
jgi:hypothetical protein